MTVGDWSIIVANILIVLGLTIQVEKTSKRKLISLIFHVIILTAYLFRIVSGFKYESSGGAGLIWSLLWFISFVAQITILAIQLLINYFLNKKRNETRNSTIEIVDRFD